MLRWNPFRQPWKDPIKSLCSLWMLWKTALLCAAALSPGLGYDTSTQILLRQHGARAQHDGHSLPASSLLTHTISRLVRWDAVYFVEIARRGYVYEQEWAFGQGFTAAVRFLSRCVFGSNADVVAYGCTAVTLSSICHLLSVLVLHSLIISLSVPPYQDRLAFITAALHIFCPAGLFLSAPYGESLFSCLNFLGLLFYNYGSSLIHKKHSRTVRQDTQILAAGICFGLATFVRSNGLLNGLIFVCDVLAMLPHVQDLARTFANIRMFLVTALAGISVAAGLVLPQWIAYNEFCNSSMTSADPRPWCSRRLPSVYSWVQSHYWNVGFLRYWTVSNLPLFFVGAPMLYLMISSAFVILTGKTPTLAFSESGPSGAQAKEGTRTDTGSPFAQENFTRSMLRRFAIPQLLLALLTLANFHVQIINRLSSGYPVWYFAIAIALANGKDIGRFANVGLRTEWVVRWMIVYAIVQGGLFASFLPPA